MTTIDLGVVGVEPFDPAGPLPRRRGTLRIAVAVVVALAASLLGGSARPGPPTVRELWSAPFPADGVGPELDDTTAYVATPGPTPGSRMKLAAYDLATGAVRWRATVPGDASSPVTPVRGARLVLLTAATATHDNGTSSVTYDSAVQAVSRETGRRVWQTGGALAGGDDTTVLLTEPDTDGRPVAVRRLRLGDGHELWRLSLAGTDAWVHDADRLITATADGDVRVYRYADGSLLAAGRLPWLTRDATSSQFTGMALLAGRLITSRVKEGRTTASTVYDPASLAELWHVGGDLSDCGPVICTDESGTATAFDPASGRQVWTARGDYFARLGGDWILVAAQNAEGDLTSYRAFDLRTGKSSVTLDPQARWAGVSGTRPILLRPTARPPGRLAVVALDPADGAVTTFGTVPPVSDQDTCSTTGDYLVCLRRRTMDVTEIG